MTADLHVVKGPEIYDSRTDDTAGPERFPHAMIDAESMASHTSRALLLSIAAVPFALEPDGPRFGEPVLMLPELGAQLLAGRLVTPDTQDFWARQKPAASEHWLGKAPTHAPRDLRAAVTAWIAANTTPDAQIWARGQAFDFGNLDNIMDTDPGAPPWKFWNLRDQRTQTAFNPKLRDRPANLVIPAAPHDPVYDCMIQAWSLWERAPGEAIGLEANPVRQTVEGLHPATADLVDRFAHALALKLKAAEAKYGHTSEWLHDNWREGCQLQLAQHLTKGDPLDVAAYAAFCWHHNWPTTQPKAGAESGAAVS